MAAQVVQVPPESVAPLAQLATHTRETLLVVEQALTSSAAEQDVQAVHVVPLRRKYSEAQVVQLLLPSLTAQSVTPALMHTRSAVAVHAVDS